MAEDVRDRAFQMRVSDAWLKTIDDWRRQQPDLPPRAEAIRRLVLLGLGSPTGGARSD